MAAICAKAGLRPTFAEPDLICWFRGEAWGVAVKRIKSLNSLKQRIEGAADQIQRAKVAGAIAVDVTMAANPENEPFLPKVSNETYLTAAIASVRTFIDEHYGRFIEWTRGAHVRGIMVMYHDIRQDPVNGWSLESTTVSAHLSPYNQRRRREFDAFAQKFNSGLATEPIRAGSA